MASITVMLPHVLVSLLAWHRSVPGLVAAAAVVLIWAGVIFFAFSSRDMVERSCANRCRRATGRLVRSLSTLVGQAQRTRISPREVSCSNNFRHRAYSNG